MQKFYVSFGQTHAHAIAGKTFDRNCIAVITAKDYQEAREIAFEAFGGIFCFIYEKEPDMQFFPRGFINLN